MSDEPVTITDLWREAERDERERAARRDAAVRQLVELHKLDEQPGGNVTER